jgi:glucose-1-phosphate thymidylyltransferase
MSHTPDEIVAVIPAAGRGTRLGDIPCSKEMLPLEPAADDRYRPAAGSRVAIEDQIHVLAENGICDAIVATAPEKADIREYLGEGPVSGVRLEHVIVGDSPSVPHTIAAALPAAGARSLLLCFPDILVHPRDLLGAVIAAHAAEDRAADVTMALVPSDRGDKVDMVFPDEHGNVLNIIPKPGPEHSGWTWVYALWTARFSAFLPQFLARAAPPEGPEIYVADVLNAGRNKGMIALGVFDQSGKALDIGTPDDLKRLWESGLGTATGGD